MPEAISVIDDWCLANHKDILTGLSNDKIKMKYLTELIRSRPSDINYYYYTLQYLEIKCITQLEGCALESSVYSLIKNDESHMFPLDDAIKICEKHNIMDACAYLVELKSKDVNVAFNIYLQLIQTHYWNYALHKSTKHKAMRYLNEFKSNALNICESSKADASECTQQWVRLFNTFYTLFQTTIKQRIANDMDYFFKGVFCEMFSRIIHCLPLDLSSVVIKQIIKTCDALSFYNHKDILAHLLQSYCEERKILVTQKQITKNNVVANLSDFISAREKGIALQNRNCSICHNYDHGEQLLCYKCKHLFHAKCVPPDVGSCPICVSN